MFFFTKLVCFFFVYNQCVVSCLLSMKVKIKSFRLVESLVHAGKNWRRHCVEVVVRNLKSWIPVGFTAFLDLISEVFTVQYFAQNSLFYVK